ncbi:MAG TPA: penicillin-binding transpeptidase domain-containing protein, partial [Candidatus Baltobacteraceae bacterium]|nr:penicillin-binding transpeptidase domain-containing protein [Candidatus Baltobacteraceae bacterium]
ATQEKKLGRELSRAERKQFALTTDQLEQMRAQARYSVACAVVSQVAQKLGEPLALDPKKFDRAYKASPYVPYPILQNLNDAQVARFEESFTNNVGVELDLQSVRNYPLNTTATHLLGYVISSDESISGEDAYFDYRLQDYKGVVGVEGGFDKYLHGRAGVESVLINNLGYRQTGNFLEQPESGNDVVLTIDLDIQRAAEQAIASRYGQNARAAVIVMDVRNGDVLAMVSSPAVDPNDIAQNTFTPTDWQRYTDTNLTVQLNRATQGGRHPLIPGSIFKPVVGLAALENGLNPREIYHVEPNPRNPAHGHIMVGARLIDDPAGIPGDYDLRRAIVRSSNSYFIYIGLKYAGIENVVRLGEKFHLGEREKLPTFQDSPGHFPTPERIHQSDWRDGDSANIFFGQGEVNVTPIQIAC